jgi:uncharacterized protein YdeI (YjbR/CyaY-like superfamily)
MSNTKPVTSSQRLIANRKWTQAKGMLNINAYIEIKHDLKFKAMYNELIFIQLSRSLNDSYDTDNAITLKADVQQLLMMAAGLKELVKYGESAYSHKGVKGNVIKELTFKIGESFTNRLNKSEVPFFINITENKKTPIGIKFDKYEIIGLYKQIEMLAEYVTKEMFKTETEVNHSSTQDSDTISPEDIVKHLDENTALLKEMQKVLHQNKSK